MRRRTLTVPPPGNPARFIGWNPNRLDDAPRENCFHTQEAQLVHLTRYTSRDAARRDLFAYTETDYNRKQLDSARGYLIPKQGEPQVA